MARGFRTAYGKHASYQGRGNQMFGRIFQGLGIAAIGTGVGAFVMPGGKFIGSLGVLTGISTLSKGSDLVMKGERQAVRARAIENIINRGRGLTSLGTPRGPQVSANRMGIARSAATRSAHEQRFGQLSRLYGARRPAAAVKKTGDGQTKGYYRNQAGKSVYVKGYATPSR